MLAEFVLPPVYVSWQRRVAKAAPKRSNAGWPSDRPTEYEVETDATG
jgi:hypothetical protein